MAEPKPTKNEVETAIRVSSTVPNGEMAASSVKPEALKQAVSRVNSNFAKDLETIHDMETPGQKQSHRLR